MGYPQNIKVTVDAVIFSRLENQPVKVLLIKRKNQPFQGKWAIPGGFVEDDEPLDVAAARELQEETGLQNVSLIQLHTFGEPERDPRERAISVTYYTIITNSEQKVEAADDASEAKWFEIDQLPELAFDHQKILALAIDHIN